MENDKQDNWDKEKAQKELELAYLRRTATDGIFLQSQVKWVREMASWNGGRDQWKFKRGRARLKYRAIGQVFSKKKGT